MGGRAVGREGDESVEVGGNGWESEIRVRGAI